MLDQKGESLIDRFGLNHVVVVQYQDEVVRDGGDLIEQVCQKQFGGRWLRLRSVEHSQHSFSNLRRNRL